MLDQTQNLVILINVHRLFRFAQLRKIDILQLKKWRFLKIFLVPILILFDIFPALQKKKHFTFSEFFSGDPFRQTEMAEVEKDILKQLFGQ